MKRRRKKRKAVHHDGICKVIKKLYFDAVFLCRVCEREAIG